MPHGFRDVPRERGELPAEAPVEAACSVIVAMVSYNSLTPRKPFSKAAFSALQDDILLPALKYDGSNGSKG